MTKMFFVNLHRALFESKHSRIIKTLCRAFSWLPIRTYNERKLYRAILRQIDEHFQSIGINYHGSELRILAAAIDFKIIFSTEMLGLDAYYTRAFGGQLIKIVKVFNSYFAYVVEEE